MKSHPRIEKSAFRKGEYIGHCFGAQKIRRCAGGWQTYGLASSQGYALHTSAPTLFDLGEKLDSYEKQAQH